MNAEDFRASRSDHERYVHQHVIFHEFDSQDVIEHFPSLDQFPIPSEGDKVDFTKLEVGHSDDAGRIELGEGREFLPDGESVTYEVHEVRYSYKKVEIEEDVECMYDPGFALAVSVGVSEVESD